MLTPDIDTKTAEANKETEASRQGQAKTDRNRQEEETEASRQSGKQTEAGEETQVKQVEAGRYRQTHIHRTLPSNRERQSQTRTQYR